MIVRHVIVPQFGGTQVPIGVWGLIVGLSVILLLAEGLSRAQAKIDFLNSVAVKFEEQSAKNQEGLRACMNGQTVRFSIEETYVEIECRAKKTNAWGRTVVLK